MKQNSGSPIFWVMKKLTVVLALLGSEHLLCFSYTIDYLDCTRPSNLKVLSIRDLCTNEIRMTNTTKKYNILTNRRNIPMKSLNVESANHNGYFTAGLSVMKSSSLSQR